MKQYLKILFFALLPFLNFGQSPATATSTKAVIDGALPDNNTKGINAATLRSTMKAIVDFAETKVSISNANLIGNTVLPTTTQIGNISPTEISYLDGVSSPIQLQIDSKIPTFTPEQFGAVGDGITDDTQALQRAIDYIVTNSKELILSKKYLVNTVQIDGNILYIKYSIGKKWKITGSGNATILCTNNSQASILWIQGDNQNSVIQNVYFQRQHSLLPNYQTGIYIGGYGGTKVKNLLIDNCTFSGFQQAISMNGSENLTIQNSKFLSLKGHDDGSSDDRPNVSINSTNNENGINVNTNIVNNFFDGYYSTDNISTTITKRPLDGFIIGQYNGLKATGNIIKNFSEEGILVQSGKNGGSILIANNQLYGDLPLGSKNANGTTKTYNYHIRVDANNAVVTNNILLGVTWGIMSRGIDFTSKNLENISISDNHIFATKQNFKNFITGISVNGNDAKTKDVVIKNNEIKIDSSYITSSCSAIEVYRTKNISLINNIATESVTTKNSNQIFGLTVSICDAINDNQNKLSGFDNKKNVSNVTGYVLENGYVSDLAGFTVGSNTTLLNTDNIIGAFAKVQGQLNAKATISETETLTNKTLTSPIINTGTFNNPIINNISPSTNFTITQNGATPINSVNSGAVANTLYLNAGRASIGTTNSVATLNVEQGSNSNGIIVTAGGSVKGISMESSFAGASNWTMMSVSGSNPSNLRFGTYSTTSRNSVNDLMVISGVTGNVGIGIGDGSPSQKLEVGGGIKSGSIFVKGADPSVSFLSLNNTSNSNSTREFRLVAGITGVSQNGFSIYDSFSATNRFVIDNTGNVGVGTTSMTSRLQVVGLPTYADNAAALAGGLTIGAFYKTPIGVVMVTY